MQVYSGDIPLQRIRDEITEKYGIELHILRIDLNHPVISGNKLYKLRYNLEEAKAQGKKSILTFGGAYSNHIAATAAAGRESGLATIGIIRGDEAGELNATLKFAQDQGMELFFVSREAYRSKESADFFAGLPVSAEIIQRMKGSYIIPEGGANIPGIKGCREILSGLKTEFDTVCCACGTGTTLTGIICSLKERQRALGFQVLKGKGYMKDQVDAWLTRSGHFSDRWTMNEMYHFGGYAKRTGELVTFIKGFEKMHDIPLDYIYTGKMMYGIYDLMAKGYFKRGERIVAVHTGGLQGNAGFDR